MADARRGFTLIELVLSISICGAMLIGALHLHYETERVREAATARMEAIGAARLLMDRITVELLGASDRSPYGVRLEGHADRLEFHTTDNGGCLVGYRQRREDSEPDGDAENEPDPQQERKRAPVVVGIERTRIGSTSLEADSEGTHEDRDNGEDGEDGEDGEKDTSDALLVSDRVRYLRIRYHDGERWHDGWRQDDLPRGVEVTLGVDTLAHGRRHHEYDGEVFRRVVAIPDSTTRGWRVPSKRENGDRR